MSGAGAVRRVLAVSDFYLPRAGGVERVVAETSRHLPDEGWAVEVLTRRLERHQSASETISGVQVWRVGCGPGPMPLELASVACDARRWAARHLGRFDLVHAHLSFVSATLLGPIRARGLPLVATFYGPWHLEYRREMADPEVPSRWPQGLRGLVHPIVARVLRRLQERLLRRADQVVVLSDHSRAELDTFRYNAACAVQNVPGGVDVERFRPRSRDEARQRLGLAGLGAPLLVTVRRLVPRMGVDMLIDAVAGLESDYPRLALVVGGEGALQASLREQARVAGLEERVRFLGRVPEGDLPWLYAAADAVVMPTRELEGFGLPVLEAWACGIPVVATPAGALPETVARLDPGLVSTLR